MRGANSLESLDSVSSSIQQARANSLNQVSLPKIISDKNLQRSKISQLPIYESWRYLQYIIIYRVQCQGFRYYLDNDLVVNIDPLFLHDLVQDLLVNIDPVLSSILSQPDLLAILIQAFWQYWPIRLYEQDLLGNIDHLTVQYSTVWSESGWQYWHSCP